MRGGARCRGSSVTAAHLVARPGCRPAGPLDVDARRGVALGTSSADQVSAAQRSPDRLMRRRFDERSGYDEKGSEGDR